MRLMHIMKLLFTSDGEIDQTEEEQDEIENFEDVLTILNDTR